MIAPMVVSDLEADPMLVGEILDEIMSALDLKQGTLAKKIGVSQGTISNTFFGKKRLRVEMQPARSNNLFFEFDISGAGNRIDGG